MSLYLTEFHFPGGYASIYYKISKDCIFYKYGNLTRSSCKKLVIINYNVIHTTPLQIYDAWHERADNKTIYGELKGFALLTNNDDTFNIRNIYIHSSLYETREELYNDVKKCGKLINVNQTFDEFKKEYIFTIDEFDKFMLEYARNQMMNIKQNICDDTNKDLSKIQEDVSKYNEKFDNIEEYINELSCDSRLIKHIFDMNCPSELLTILDNIFVQLITDCTENLLAEKGDLDDYVRNLKVLYESKKVKTLRDYAKLKDLIVDILEMYDSECGNSVFYLYEKLKKKLNKLRNKNENITVKHTTLNQDNLLQEAITFHKKNNLSSIDFIETIQEMLDTKQYELSETFMSSKINFQEANTYFMSSIAPKKVKKEDLQRLLFKNIVCDDLI